MEGVISMAENTFRPWDERMISKVNGASDDKTRRSLTSFGMLTVMGRLPDAISSSSRYTAARTLPSEYACRM